MAEVTVSQFADVLKVPVERLITQLDEAGIKVAGADDIISDEAKMELLTHLRRAHGRVEDAAAPRRITLQRKSQSEIKLASQQGRARTVKRRGASQADLPQPDRARGRAAAAAGGARSAAPGGRGRPPRSRAPRAGQARLPSSVSANGWTPSRGARPTTRPGCGPRKRHVARRTRESARRPSAASRRVRRPRPPRTRRRDVPRCPPRSARARSTAARSCTSASMRVRASRRSRRSAAVVTCRSASMRGTASSCRPRRSSATCSVSETITVGELANRMAVKANEVIKVMMKMGVMATINQPIDQDTAQLVVEEFGHTAVRLKADTLEEQLQVEDSDAEALAAAAGRDHHGPRRPRQDLAPRLHPAREGRCRRGGRHHPAHRRLPGGDAEGPDHVHRHARPRRVHRDARPRRARHRHRRAGRRGRRRRDAADGRGDPACARGERRDGRRRQQDRQGRRGSRPRA